MRTRTFIAAFLVLLSVALAACGEEAPVAPAAPARPAPKAAAPGNADGGMADAVAEYVYIYNPIGKRDPFRTEGAQVAKGVAQPDPSSNCGEPLCSYDIEQLSLVAVITGDATPIAMVEDPNRVGHVVKRNTRVGKQGGKVTEIQRECLVVTEYFTTPDGKVNPNKVNMCVKKEDQGKSATDLLTNKQLQ